MTVFPDPAEQICQQKKELIRERDSRFPESMNIFDSESLIQFIYSVDFVSQSVVAP